MQGAATRFEVKQYKILEEASTLNCFVKDWNLGGRGFFVLKDFILQQ